MPYRKHNVFDSPQDEYAKVWRFMNLPKFVSILQHTALFFIKSSKLDDPYEGTIPTYDRERREMWYRELTQTALGVTEQEIQKSLKESDGLRALLNTEDRELSLVSSWHLNEDESASMWKLYSNDNTGIVIQTTFHALCDSFSQNEEDVVYVGKVRYADYNREGTSMSNGFEPLMMKRKSFECERELRAITTWPHDLKWELLKNLKGVPKETQRLKYSVDDLLAVRDKIPDGKYVATDLETLIQKIYVAPSSKPWYLEIVNSILSKYLPSKHATKSEMYELK